MAKVEPNPGRAAKARKGSLDEEQVKFLINKKLERSKEAGQKRRWAIVFPSLCLGLALFVPGGIWFLVCKILAALDAGPKAFAGLAWVGGWTGAAGIPILLLSLLPEDVELIRSVVKVIAGVFAFIATPGAFSLVILAIMGRLDGCKDQFGMDDTVPCWYADVVITWVSLFAASYMGMAGLLFSKLREGVPARELLNYTWTCLGRWCVLTIVRLHPRQRVTNRPPPPSPLVFFPLPVPPGTSSWPSSCSPWPPSSACRSRTSTLTSGFSSSSVSSC